jgi:predicted nucleotidyltransferase component of viral defense system
MISLEELNTVKEKRKTSLYYEEKEYLQYIFLNAISRYADDFTFKGGTCLRVCFGLERASEDLDFNTSLSVEKAKEAVNRCLHDFELLNIRYELYGEKEFAGNLRMEIRFYGPLFSGRTASTNTLKIDLNRGRARNTAVKVVQKLFSDVPLFTLVVMDEKEILAEKIRSLVNRAEPRDLYDVWMLLNKGVVIDKGLLHTKLKEEKVKLSGMRLPSKEQYNTSLKNLLTTTPPYEQVKREVEEAMGKAEQKTSLQT